MSGGSADDDGRRDPERFADAVDGDVRPLREGSRRIDARRRRPVSTPQPSRESPAPLLRPDPHEPRLAHIRDFDRRTLRRLKRGEITVDLELDLHGMTAAAARSALRRAVGRCVRERLRLLLVIHGRGRHSGDAGPVLRERLPEWLDEPAIVQHLLASAPARAHDGGAGATLVYLRRGRAEAGAPADGDAQP